MSSRILLGAFIFIGLIIPTRGQEPKAKDDDMAEKNLQAFRRVVEKAEEEYRLFFKKPDKPHEFWAAMKFEVETGKYDIAALHMKFLLERQPPEETDKALVQLQETEGLYAFLKLQSIKKWSEHPPFNEEAINNVQVLIKRLTTAVETHLSDPARIAKYIVRLDAKHPEERSFALVQLNRSRERAVPYMIEALRVNLGKPLYTRIVEALVAMDREAVPPFLEVLKAVDAKEAQDLDLRLTLLEILQRRNDKRCVPYLWHMASAKQYPPIVRQAALNTLAFFLKKNVNQLPPAKMMLLELAENYYQHKVRFESRTVKIWPWDGQSLALKPWEKTEREAEEYYGLRHAREALDLDPASRPAQVVFLSLMLERAFERDLDKFFLQPMPEAIQNLLATVDADLLMDVLERVRDNKTAVALPCINVLGQRGESRAARLGNDNQPRALARALFHPDRRVQFAAAVALARMPASTATVGGAKPIENRPPPPVAAERVVEVLTRFLAADQVPKALAGFVPPEQINEVKNALKQSGFDPVIGRNLAETLAQLKKSADIDVILLHAHLPAKDRGFVLGQLRGGVDQRLMPIVLLTPQKIPEVIRFMGHWSVETGDLLHTWTIQYNAGRWNIFGNLAIGGTLLGFFHAENVALNKNQLDFSIVFDKKPNFDQFVGAEKMIDDSFWEPGTTGRLVVQENQIELEWKNKGLVGRLPLRRISLDEHQGKGVKEFPWLKDWVGAWNDPSPGSELRKTWFVRIHSNKPLIYGYYFKGDKIEGYFTAEKVRISNDRLEFVPFVDKKPAADQNLTLWDAKEVSLVPQGDVFQLNRANDPFGRFVKLNRILSEPVLAEEGYDLEGESAMRLARRFAHVLAAPESLLLLPEQMKRLLDEAVQAVNLKPVTVDERKLFARVSMDLLWKMARGEIRGYDVRGAREAVFFALRNEDMALFAIEVLGRLPGTDTQQRLAALVLDPRYQKLHIPGAFELNRHVQKNGLQLDRPQLLELRKAYDASKDAELRAQLAILLGSSRPSATQSGQKLIQFQPPPPVDKK